MDVKFTFSNSKLLFEGLLECLLEDFNLRLVLVSNNHKTTTRMILLADY